MSFTANEMVTAISNSPANMDLQDRFERAGFAEWLAAEYGDEGYDHDAPEFLAWLLAGETQYEGDPVSYWYRDLVEYRSQQS